MKRIALALCAVVICAVAAPAGATVMVASYSGVLVAGNDQSGIFVAPNGSLAGYRFVASFTYDTSLGVRTTVPGVSDHVVGGDMLGDATPVLSATLSLNGVTYDFMSNYYGEVKTEDGLVGHTTEADVPHLVLSYITGYSVVSGGPTSLEDSAQDLHTVASFSLVQFDILTRASQSDPFTRTFGNTRLGDDLTYSVAPLADPGGGGNGGGVPEPSAWTLMIAGFGLVGGALRRRKAALSTALRTIAAPSPAVRNYRHLVPAALFAAIAAGGVAEPATAATPVHGALNAVANSEADGATVADHDNAAWTGGAFGGLATTVIALAQADALLRRRRLAT